MKHRHANPFLVFAVIAALLLGACSSGGDDEADDTTTTTSEAAPGGDESTTTGGDGGDDDTTTTGGGSGDPVDVGADGQAYVDAMVESMQGDEDFPLSDDQAECFSSRFVDTIGVDRLQAAGVTPESMANDDDTMEFTDLDLSNDEGNELYDHFGDCGIDLSGLMMESMAADEETTPEMRACMEGVFTDDNLRKLMVSSMVNGDEAMDDDPELAPLMGQLMGCAFMGMDSGDTDTEGTEG